MQYIKPYLLLLFLAIGFTSCQKKDTYQSLTYNTYLVEQVDTLSSNIDQLIHAIEHNQDSTQLRQRFIASRLAYKKIEWAVSYFLPHTAAAINGPALDQLDLDENKFIPAEGFQVVEEFLYPVYDSTSKEELLLQARKLKNLSNKIHKNFEAITFEPASVLEALKLEIFQITTLGITGFDTPASKLQFIEATASLSGVNQAIQASKTWTNTQAYATIDQLLTEAIALCQVNPAKNSFDYLTFILKYLDPLAKEIVALQRELAIPFLQTNQVIGGETGSLFDANTINLNAFLPDSTYYPTSTKIALGKELFFDQQLSKENTRSCATCHHPDKAFSENRKTSLDLTGNPLHRNALSLNYAAYYHGQFWDMRSVTLESQTSDVITNKDEMHGNLQEIVQVLNQSETYKKHFAKAYQTDAPIAVWQVENALASYIRSLSTFNSRFDQYMRGNKQAMTAQEQQGFNLFVGKAQCATCHFLPVFNGTVSPYFRSSEQEILGVPKDKAGTQLDDDLGRYVFNTDLDQLKHSFKTPTVRNINESGPYMHNGVYETLEEVMDFYNKGGGLGLGLKVENQTLPDTPLDLTDQEIQAIVAFMKALSDQA
ncbi:cytochrome c peroxidase [Myroides odoratus]|uniref:cytochrome c peroxidase n=1 Tax=Myroides odoratus TaxID=256 RepID=UPI000765FAB9|nr:cytochrome c peroxidase [Myroides odoratus]